MTFQFADRRCNAISATGEIIKLKQAAGVKPISAFLYRPARSAGDLPPLVAVHGISRKAKEQAELFSNLAEQTGRTIVAPRFGHKHWTNYQRITNSDRADLALIALLRWLDERGIASTRQFDLFGYSGGAQFAHRFAMLYPHKISKLSVAAAGWYCMPNDSAAHPYGLASETGKRVDWGARMRASLEAYLQLPISVFIGADDRLSDAAVRRTPALDAAQGTNRLERAQRYCEVLGHTAHARDITPNISLTTLPGCRHSFEQCVKIGGLDQLVLNPNPSSSHLTQGIAL